MRGGQRGFLLLELVLGVAVLLIVLAVVFNLFKPAMRLQMMASTQVNLLQNQTLVMQRISQQVAVYTRTATIEAGSSDRLVLNDVSGNKIISFYQGHEAGGVSVLYISTQIPPEVAGNNQLTDPNNVEVLHFKAYKMDTRKLKVELSLRDKNNEKEAVFTEIIYLLNGEVL